MSTTVVHPESVSGHGPSGRTIGMAVVGLVVAAAIGFGIANQSAPETTGGGVATAVDAADTKYLEAGATRAAQQQLLMKEATSGVTQSAPAVNMPAATVPLPEVALGAGGIGTPGETPWPEVVFGTTATTFDLNQYIADEIARFNAPVQDAPWPDVIGFELPVRDPNLAVADILVAEYAALQPKVLEGARLQALNETFPPVSGDWLITQALIEAHAAEQANLAKGAAMHGLNETYPTGTEAPGTAPDLGGIR